MRKTIVLGLALALAVTPLALAGAVETSPTVDLSPLSATPIASDNVTYHGTIPIDSPGIGGEVVVREDLDGAKFFYATGGKGLSVYDVSDPALPLLVGFLPFPHAQNEDLKVSDDGTKAVIAADGSILVPVAPATTGIHVIDLTDPTSPEIIGSSSALVRGDGEDLGTSEHTAECADADCTWIYGRTGRIYDATNLPEIVEVGNWNVDQEGNSVGGIHALNRDETGLVISDSEPRLVLDTVGRFDPSATPDQPVVISQGNRDRRADNRLQHNNVRTDPAGWDPREGDPVETAVAGVDFEVNPRSVSVLNERPVLRDGELMLGNSETNLNNNCNMAGGLSTWSIADFDEGAPMQQLEVFRPLNGTWADGSPAVNGLGCSGHWFTENDGIVAASWYEHGVRFFDIDKTVGTITEIGYFQPLATEAGAAYWIDDEFVYSVDYARGIDIISFDRGAEEPTQAQLDASWLVNLNRVGQHAQAERMLCALATRS